MKDSSEIILELQTVIEVDDWNWGELDNLGKLAYCDFLEDKGLVFIPNVLRHILHNKCPIYLTNQYTGKIGASSTISPDGSFFLFSFLFNSKQISMKIDKQGIKLDVFRPSSPIEIIQGRDGKTYVCRAVGE